MKVTIPYSEIISFIFPCSFVPNGYISSLDQFPLSHEFLLLQLFLPSPPSLSSLPLRVFLDDTDGCEWLWVVNGGNKW